MTNSSDSANAAVSANTAKSAMATMNAYATVYSNAAESANTMYYATGTINIVTAESLSAERRSAVYSTRACVESYVVGLTWTDKAPCVVATVTDRSRVRGPD